MVISRRDLLVVGAQECMFVLMYLDAGHLAVEVEGECFT